MHGGRQEKVYHMNGQELTTRYAAAKAELKLACAKLADWPQSETAFADVQKWRERCVELARLGA